MWSLPITADRWQDVAVEVSDAINSSMCELAGSMIAATSLLGGHGHFLHWGVIQLSLANLIVIVLMLVVFALAVLVPFPHARDAADPLEGHDDSR